jgi:hypothetical protein
VHVVNFISFSERKTMNRRVSFIKVRMNICSTHGDGIIAQSLLSTYMEWAELNDGNNHNFHL